MTSLAQRGRYQGAVQILRFNWPMYLAAVAGAGLAATLWPLASAPARAALLALTAPALFWMASSLLVSHFVYDRSALYDLRWVLGAVERLPDRWINIHCGLDETSTLLAALFPGAAGELVDIFDPRVMTESSIRKARWTRRGEPPSASVHFYAMPFAGGSFDAIFSFFAAHELRRHTDRVRLFAEITRLTAHGGVFVLVEHLRDGWNFLAFGPGFLHFFSRRTWQRAARQAGLTPRTEFSLTPFVHVWIFGRAA